MTNFLSVFKLDLKLNFQSLLGDKSKMAKRIGLLVLLLVAFAIPLALIFVMLYFMAQVAVLFGGFADELINLVFTAIQLIILVFFLPSYVNTVWFSKDRQLLSSMPIGGSAVFVSRMLIIYISTALISVVLSVIGGAVIAAGSASAEVMYAELIAQGIVTPTAQTAISGTAEYYIMMIVAGLTLPVLPLFIMAVLSFPLMKIISYFKRTSAVKTVIMMLAYGAFFALIYVGYFALQNGMSGIVIDGSQVSFEMVGALMESMCGFTRYVYPSYFAAAGMCGEWESSLIYVAVRIGCGALTVLGRRVYFTLADTKAVVSTGKKKQQEKERHIKSAGVRLALIKKDFITLLREPQLAFQSLSGLILGPIMLLIINIALPMGAAEGTEDMYPVINGATSLLLLILFTCGTNLLASIAVSREGQSFKIVRFMPVSGRDIVISKLILADIFSFICILVDDIVLLSLSVFNVVDFFGALISVTLINMGINTFSVWRDIKQPKLIYNNIRELVKSSSKTLMSMLISLVVAIVGLALYIGIPFAGLEKYAASAAIWGAMTAFAIIVFCVFRINSVKRMSEGIERIE